MDLQPGFNKVRPIILPSFLKFQSHGFFFYLRFNYLNEPVQERIQGEGARGGHPPPPPPQGDLRLSNNTGILQIIKRHQSATPFLSGAPPPKKNPGSVPAVIAKEKEGTEPEKTGPGFTLFYPAVIPNEGCFPFDNNAFKLTHFEDDSIIL